MDYTGKYRLVSIYTIIPEGEGIKRTWLTPEEYVAHADQSDPHELKEATMIANSLILVEADGHYFNMIPIPEGVSQEEIDKAAAEGHIRIVENKYMIMSREAPGRWEMRGDDFYTMSGVQGTLLEQEMDPWVKSNQEDGTLLLGDLVQIKYQKI